jgi:hypothetical protein
LRFNYEQAEGGGKTATEREGEAMKIIITLKDTDNIIGLKEEIAMRLEDVVDIIRIDIETEGK